MRSGPLTHSVGLGGGEPTEGSPRRAGRSLFDRWIVREYIMYYLWHLHRSLQQPRPWPRLPAGSCPCGPQIDYSL